MHVVFDRGTIRGSGSSSSSGDEFAPTRFPDGYRIELIESS